MHRWQQGERVPRRSVLQMHRAGRRPGRGLFDLVYGEYLLREELGELPTIDDFVKRFPQYALQLQRQAKVHDAIESGKRAPKRPSCTPCLRSCLGATAEQLAKMFRDRLADDPGYNDISQVGARGMRPGLQAMQTPSQPDVALKVIKQECLLQEPKAAMRFT